MAVMRTIVLVFVILMNSVYSLQIVNHPDRGLSIVQIIRKYGYPVEIHEVITQDGYITQAFRIPRGKNSTKSVGEPVLFVHGQCGCSENFINAGPSSSASYFLADHGYDVWLMNNRGNRHGRSHKTKDPDKDPSFWNFGWHEIAIYDITANIDYILRVTNRTKLYYIGHSSGSTSYLAFAADRPEYADKIKVAALLAPSAIFSNPIPGLSLLNDFLVPIMNTGIIEVFPLDINRILNGVLRNICREVTIVAKICAAFLYFGKVTTQMDLISPQHIYETSPAGCAIQGLVHYGQLLKTRRFYKYDYGMKKNLEIYKSRRPPLYNLTNAKAPVALFHAPADNLIDNVGVSELGKQLPNLATLYRVPTDDFNHVDFIFGKNGNLYVNGVLLKLFEKYKDTS